MSNSNYYNTQKIIIENENNTENKNNDDKLK